MKKRKPWYARLWAMAKKHINFNSILTSVLGSLACALLALVLKWSSDNYQLIKQIPGIEAKVEHIQKEQERVKKEYVPPTKPGE